MVKTVPTSKFQEWIGLDRISQIVHEMRCIFREISKDDFGLDGEIELVEQKADGGFAATGGIVKVQAKSGTSYVKQNSETSFVTSVQKSDLELWHNATFPVLYIVYHPEDDELYWKEVRSYARSAPAIWQPPYRIVYDKAADRFSPSSYEQLREIAHASPRRVTFQQQEKLYSNLLPVSKLPRVLTHAPTEFADLAQIRSEVRGTTPPIRLIGGRLYTLADLRDPRCPLRPFCNTKNISDLLAVEWINDEAHQRDYVSLLNQLLGIHAHRCGLKYNRDLRRNYFPRLDPKSSEFKLGWFNVRTGRAVHSRLVVKHYSYGGLEFWRHLAVKLDFRCLGASWFLQVLPRYLFTTDGETPYDRTLIGPLTTKLKAVERNPHVLNHVLFWADVLAQGNSTISMAFGPRPSVVVEKLPLQGIANFAIPFDPAVYEEQETGEMVQVDLFDPLFGPDDEVGDEY